MSRKDYIAIAAVLASNRERSSAAEEWRCDTIARELADYFATTNPRFDRARFLRACGVAS